MRSLKEEGGINVELAVCPNWGDIGVRLGILESGEE